MCAGAEGGDSRAGELRVAWGGQGRVWRGRMRLGLADGSGPGCQRVLGAWLPAGVKPWPWPSWEKSYNSSQPHIPLELLLNLDSGF